MKIDSYLYNLLNEGFDVRDFRGLSFNDSHERVLNTSLDAKPVIGKIYVRALKNFVTTYSVFQRVTQEKGNDSNPVLYALKGENDWHFTTSYTEKIFWERFSQLLHNFLLDHKNEFETTIVVPTSRTLNGKIIEHIKKYAEEVGINNFISGMLRKVDADEILDSVYKHNSPFYKEYSYDINLWRDKIEQLESYIDRMNLENGGKFKYHYIKDTNMRKLIMNTLEVVPNVVTFFKPQINGKNILIVDDSITHGQTIKDAINAIVSTYQPASVSVLTMFSKLSLEGTDYHDYKGAY